jgi:predicted metalloprotease with PDZ domain
MNKFLSAAALFVAASLSALAQDKYAYAVDLVNIQKDQVAVTLKTPVVAQDVVTFSFAKAIPGSYARKDFGRFITDLEALDKLGNKLKVQKLGKNQYSIANAKSLATIKYKVSDTWDEKHDDFIFQPGGSNIEAGANVVMNNHAFYGYFEGYSKLPVEIEVTKPADFYAATHLDVSHPSAQQDVIKAKDFVYLADNPVIYSRPDTTSFYVGKSKINVLVYSATGKVKSAQVANYLKPTAQALNKFFNGLPVSSYQFLFYFEDPSKALADRKKGEGGYGALEHSYSSLYYLPETEFEKDLISMVNDVSSHEFLHILTPLNLHSYEIENFDFTNPKMSQHLWLYEGVTEYFAQLIQWQNGLTDEKKFFTEMRNKMNQAEEFGDFAMTEMSKRVLEDAWQKKYSSVYNRGALLGLMLDLHIREKTGGQKDLKKVILTLTKKYGPSKPFKDDDLFADFIAASHPDVSQFINSYLSGVQPLAYADYFAKVGYEYSANKDVPVFYPGKMGLKYENKNFVFSNVDNNALNIKEGDILKKLDGTEVTGDNINDLWDAYFSENTTHPEMAITIERGGKDQVLQGKAYSATMKAKNYLAPIPGASAQQQAMLKALSGE